MTLVLGPEVLAVAIMEGVASTVILVLYWLLLPGFRARFFRYWLAGWTLYVVLEGLRIENLLRGRAGTTPLTSVLSVVPALFFLAATLECRKRSQELKHLWVTGGVLVAAFAIFSLIPKLSYEATWTSTIVVSALYLSSGWIFWRSQALHSGVGWKLVSAALMLWGLDGLDRPEWTQQGFQLFRLSFHSLFGITMGIAMAVLVLEAGRARTEELNEKLRRLSLITAEATHSFRMEQVLDSVLGHLVEILGASHGVVLLLENPDNSPALVTRAFAGGNGGSKDQSRIPVTESWIQAVLRQSTPVVSSGAPGD